MIRNPESITQSEEDNSIRTPKRVEIKELFDKRDSNWVEASLLRSRMAFYKPYPSRRINSLYFDSHDMRSLEESLEGTSIRTKTRLRWYGERNDKKRATLELKRKQGHLSWKKLYKNQFEIFPEGKTWEKVILTKDDRQSAINHRLNSLRPTSLISYVRKYFVSADGVLRITIDDQVSFYNQNHSRGPNIRHGTELLGKIVLEIKVPQNYQNQLRILSRDLPFVPRRFSKYCESLIPCKDLNYSSI